MTRETKIGLLIGLAIIVLVAVIVSDYVAVQHRDSSADLLNDPAVRAADPQPAVEPDPVPTRTLTFRDADPRATANRQIPTPEEIDRALAGSEPANPRQPIAHERVDEPTPTLVDLAAVERFTERVFPPTLLARDERTIPTPEEIDAQPTQRLAPEPVAPVTPVTRQTTADNDTPSPARPTLVHTVESGDTLYTIAQRYLGNGDAWRQIARLNPDAVSDDGHVVEGARLLIPHRQGNTDLTPAASRDRSPSPRTVTVREGDSLAKIARRHLGSADRWPDLLNANRDTIDSPNTIRVGQTLRLPADEPAPAANTARRQANPVAAFNGRRTYTVREGDTLASIAADTLGDRNRWNDLYQANRNRLSSPDLVRPGQTLNLP